MFAASRYGPVISHSCILSTVFRHRCLLFEGARLEGEDSAAKKVPLGTSFVRLHDSL